MSVLPYFLDYQSRWPRRLQEQNFGLAITADDLINATARSMFPQSAWPRSWCPKDAGSSIKSDKDKWQINVDVQHFAPDEVTVKIFEGFIIVEGEHEEKQDEHGFVSRQFVRRFKIPEDVNPDCVESKLSSDGVLTVVAPKKADMQKGERAVPITHTGPVRKQIVDDSPKPQKE